MKRRVYLTRRMALQAAWATAIAFAEPIRAAAPTGLTKLQIDPLTPILGDAQALRIMAVYFDYHCPYCRAMDPLLPILANRNPDLQIQFKELPILRWDSEAAARIALSAQLRGRYLEAHKRLMTLKGDYTGTVATDIAVWLRVDANEFRKDMGSERVSAELEANSLDAERLGIQATPAIVTVNGVVQGGRSLNELQKIVHALK